MDGYLMRLVRRTRTAGATQPVRPFVRSASPIAERDQRIGMQGFEGMDAGGSLPVEVAADSETEFGQGEVLQPPGPPGITAVGDVGMVTVQRKIAGLPISPAASPTPVSQSSSEMLKPPVAIPPLNPPLTKGGRQEGSLAKGETFGPLPLTKGEGWGEGLPGRGEGWGGSLQGGQVETAAFQPDTVETYDGISSHAGPHRRAEPVQPRRDDVDKLSTRQARQIDTPRIEPSARTFARYPESSPVEAGISADETAEGPRVVIGRVNVEVVPPPPTPSSAAAPRPRPLTAASASVIGPLGGGIRPNLRFSLRHR